MLDNAEGGHRQPDRFEVSGLRDRVEVLVAAQEHLVVDQRRRRVEPVVERVLRQHLDRSGRA